MPKIEKTAKLPEEMSIRVLKVLVPDSSVDASLKSNIESMLIKAGLKPDVETVSLDTISEREKKGDFALVNLKYLD